MISYPHWALRPYGALHNARESLAVISASVADRLALTPSSVLDEGDEPGGLRAITVAQCYQLLAEESVGRLAYIARAETPDIVPVNYVLDGGDVVIRSGPGPKLQAAERRAQVAFEVDCVDRATRTGWSVVVIGRAIRLRLTEQRQHADGPAPWASGPRSAAIRIRPSRITGRHLN